MNITVASSNNMTTPSTSSTQNPYPSQATQHIQQTQNSILLTQNTNRKLGRPSVLLAMSERLKMVKQIIAKNGNPEMSEALDKLSPAQQEAAFMQVVRQVGTKPFSKHFKKIGKGSQPKKPRFQHDSNQGEQEQYSQMTSTSSTSSNEATQHIQSQIFNVEKVQKTLAERKRDEEEVRKWQQVKERERQNALKRKEDQNRQIAAYQRQRDPILLEAERKRRYSEAKKRMEKEVQEIQKKEEEEKANQANSI